VKREEILAMDTTELRIAVAEKVFHAKVIGKDGANPPQFLLVGDKGNGWSPLSGRRWQDAHWHYSEESAWNDCPEYGESISAAWEVIEKLKSNYEHVTVNNATEKSIGVLNGEAEIGWWHCNFRSEESNFAYAKTAQEAICKAALLAVMREAPPID
jgi:hypothetical protein